MTEGGEAPTQRSHSHSLPWAPDTGSHAVPGQQRSPTIGAFCSVASPLARDYSPATRSRLPLIRSGARVQPPHLAHASPKGGKQQQADKEAAHPELAGQHRIALAVTNRKQQRHAQPSDGAKPQQRRGPSNGAHRPEPPVAQTDDQRHQPSADHQGIEQKVPTQQVAAAEAGCRTLSATAQESSLARGIAGRRENRPRQAY